jgi:hypothetical protein
MEALTTILCIFALTFWVNMKTTGKFLDKDL